MQGARGNPGPRGEPGEQGPIGAAGPPGGGAGQLTVSTFETVSKDLNLKGMCRGNLVLYEKNVFFTTET